MIVSFFFLTLPPDPLPRAHQLVQRWLSRSAGCSPMRYVREVGAGRHVVACRGKGKVCVSPPSAPLVCTYITSLWLVQLSRITFFFLSSFIARARESFFVRLLLIKNVQV